MNREDFVHTISQEKIEEFRHMSVRDRLQWLEDANEFVNKAIGIEGRAKWDKRFEVFLDRKK